MATIRSKTPPVPVPEPDLTPRRMVERAIALRPLLRERQAETEAAGRVLDDVYEACVGAGFFRLLQPRRFGGYEFDLPTFADVFIELSRGCPSTGWAVTFTAGHTHVFSKFDERAQVEGYGPDGEFRAPMVGASGKARPVHGGYVCSGAWDYASGSDGATHFFGSCTVEGTESDATPRTLNTLFDRSHFRIIDNWDVLGMRGSGSRRVVVEDVFVPEYRTNFRSPLVQIDERQQPGYGLFDNPMYAGPSINVLMCEIAAVGIGTGLAALDAYEEILKARTTRGMTALRSETPEYQRHYGQARALLDTARDALVGCARDYMEYCRRDAEEDDRFVQDKSLRITMVEQQCCRLAGEAVELLFYSAGSQAARTGSPMQRYYRDMATLRTHTTLQPERTWEAFARAHFGVSVPPGSAPATFR